MSEEVLCSFLLNWVLDFRGYHTNDWCSMVVVVSAKLEHVTWSLPNGGFAAVSLLKFSGKEIKITYLCTYTLFFYENIFYNNMGCKKYIPIKECRCASNSDSWS